MKKNNRFRLKQDEIEVLNQYRAIKNASDEIGVNDKDVKHGWLKSKDASLFFKNPSFDAIIMQSSLIPLLASTVSIVGKYSLIISLVNEILTLFLIGASGNEAPLNILSLYLCSVILSLFNHIK